MKLISWNVNGLRACIEKGFLDIFDRFDADFFCLQETKLSEGQLILELPGYEQYWCYAEKKGYSGTAIFTKHTPMSVRYGLGVADLDKEGRVITLEYPEFYLVNCYTPNAQKGLARIDHRMNWDAAFRHYLGRLDEKKPVILCGDLNVAHQEIDLKNPASNRGSAGFSDRERESFQKTLDMGFTDTFRRLYPDRTGAYSWWSYMYNARQNNAGWRIDYFLVSDRVQNAIYKADIHSDILGSDHCPVSVELGLTCNGGIWSPMSLGKAKQIYPAPKENPSPAEKTKKPSAKKAKGLVALVLVCLTVLAAVCFWPDEPFLDLGGSNSQSIFTCCSYATDDYTIIRTTLTADSQEFYTTGSLPHGVYNTLLRVEATSSKLKAAGAEPAVQYRLPDGLAYKSVNIVYYTDPDCTIFGGWLFFVSLPYEVECTVTVTGNGLTDSMTCLLIPTEEGGQPIQKLDSYFTVTPMTNPLYETPISYTTRIRVYDSVSGFSYVFDEDRDPYIVSARDISTYSCWFFIQLTDQAAGILEDDDLLRLTSTSNLVIRKVYQSYYPYNFVGWVAYGDLDWNVIPTFNLFQGSEHLDTEYSFTSPYVEPALLEQLSTEELIDKLASNAYFNYILSQKSAYQTDEYYQQLRADFVGLDELLDRPDLVNALMYSGVENWTSSHMNITKYVVEYYIYDQLTPEQEVDYIVGSYPNCLYKPYEYKGGQNTISQATIDELLSICFGYSKILIDIKESSSIEIAAMVLEKHLSFDPVLQELAARENVTEEIQRICEEYSYDNYLPFLEVWEYRQEQLLNESVTTQ